MGQDGKVLRKSGGLGGHSAGGLGDLGGLGVPGGLVDQQHLGEERASSVVSDNPHLYSRSISMVGHHIRGILVRLVMCVMVGHRKLKIEIIKLLTILC